MWCVVCAVCGICGVCCLICGVSIIAVLLCRDSARYSSAIGDCLGGIMSVVAQNIVLEARPAVEGVTINNCFEENREVKISEDGIYRISFGDMYAGERRDTIFKIDVDPCRCPETNAPLVTFKLKYLDAINESMSESEVTCIVNRVEDNEVNANLTNKSVSSQVVRAVIGKALSEANKLADKYNCSVSHIHKTLKLFKKK